MVQFSPVEPVLIPGRVALVTGSTRGLGRAIARRLALGGARVMLHDLDAEAVSRFGEGSGPEQVVAELSGLGTEADVAYGDLTSPAACARLVDATLARFGRLDVLINNAGGDIGASGNKPVPNDCVEIPDEDIRVLIDRNLLTVINMSRAACRPMMAQGSGAIVSIASLAGMVPVDEGAIYAVAKAAVIHWTLCLAKQLRPHGITVNCISPGPTVTARFLATRHVEPEKLQDRGRLTRLGQPDDIARACLFFASDLADYVSGQNIVIAGGPR